MQYDRLSLQQLSFLYSCSNSINTSKTLRCFAALGFGPSDMKACKKSHLNKNNLQTHLCEPSITWTVFRVSERWTS